jgi:hypothetical protein
MRLSEPGNDISKGVASDGKMRRARGEVSAESHGRRTPESERFSGSDRGVADLSLPVIEALCESR